MQQSLTKKLKENSVVIVILFSFTAALLIISVRQKDWFLGEFTVLGELAVYDYLIKWQKYLPDNRIVLVTITEEDIYRLRQWPLPDGTLAQLLKTIVTNYQPMAVGLDIYRDFPVEPGQEQLRSFFAENPNIVTVMKIGSKDSYGVSPPYMVDDTDFIGFNDMVSDPGGVVRRGLLFLDDGKQSFYSFSLLLAILYLEKKGILPQPDNDNPEFLRLGKVTFVPFEKNDGGYVNADARGYQVLLDFQSGRESFKKFSFMHILSRQVPQQFLKDKIVIIGSTAESLNDFFFTPFSRHKSFYQRMPGMELHAHLTSQLLRGAIDGIKPFSVISERYEFIWILIWALIGGAIGLWVRSFSSFLFFSTCVLIALGGITYFTFQMRYWIPFVSPALAWFLSAGAVTVYLSKLEKHQKAILMQMFSKYVSKDIASLLWRQREQFMQSGKVFAQELTATVLFTDLKDFTIVSEKLKPSVLMDWLNDYMKTMTQIIINHKGIVNKYIGDAIMGVFGVPIARVTEYAIKQDAFNAVTCAINMVHELNRLNKKWEKNSLPITTMRIGIFTGPLVAGSIGNKQRMEYTVIGDTVNTASRLESYNKNFTPPSCRILIGKETLQYLDNRFDVHEEGTIQLKGKDKTVTIYRIFDDNWLRRAESD